MKPSAEAAIETSQDDIVKEEENSSSMASSEFPHHDSNIAYYKCKFMNYTTLV